VEFIVFRAATDIGKLAVGRRMKDSRGKYFNKACMPVDDRLEGKHGRRTGRFTFNLFIDNLCRLTKLMDITL
jgi:hypothetical protein